jgi:hypothetical protein
MIVPAQLEARDPIASALKRLKAPTVRDFLWISSPPENIPPRGFPEIYTVVEVVCQKYKVSMRDILSDRRTAWVIWPRHVAMYLCRELTPLSYPVLGRMFRRDHTTLIHAYQKIERRIAADHAFAADIDELARMIEPLPAPAS